MFLKLSYGKSVKKVVFREEFKNFEGFMQFIELVTKRSRGELVVSTVDKEGEKVPISDQYELDYFVEQTKNDPMSIATIEGVFGTDSQAAFAESKIEPFTVSGEDRWQKFNEFVQEQLKPIKDAFAKNLLRDEPLFRKRSEVSVATSPHSETVQESFTVEKKSVGVFPGSKKNSISIPDEGQDRKKSDAKASVESESKSKAPENSFEVKPEARKASMHREEGPNTPIHTDRPFIRYIEDGPQLVNPPQPQNEVNEKNQHFQERIVKRLEELERSYDAANQAFMQSGQDTSVSREIPLSGKILPDFKKPVAVVREQHAGVTCDMCGVSNIPGRRYKCLVCANFDLCENCEAKNNHLHPMVRILSHTTFNWELVTAKFAKIQSNVSKRQSERTKDFNEKMAFLAARFPGNERVQEKLLRKHSGLGLDDFKLQINSEGRHYPQF